MVASRALLSAVALFISACGGGEVTVAQDDALGSRLRAAAKSTLGSDSFRVTISVNGPPGTEAQPWFVDYLAPDRMREVGPGDDEQITVGDVVYISHPHRPGFFIQMSAPRAATIGTFLAPLEALARATDVRASGGLYSFDYPAVRQNPPGAGEARVSGGKVVMLRISEVIGEDAFVMTHEFTLFDEVSPFDPPPPGRVRPPDEGAPETCAPGATPGPGGPATACVLDPFDDSA